MDLDKYIECKKICTLKGGTLLTQFSGNFNKNSKFKFKCKEGHVWETTQYLVSKGHWCPTCSRKISSEKQKGSIEPVLRYIKSKKGKFISCDYKNQHSRVLIECEYGHRWSPTCNNLLSKKSWCRECYGTSRRNIDEMIQIGIHRGGTCLSKMYINDSTKLEWRCSEGHIFWSTPNNIKHGKWCPQCSTGIYERICRLYFERIFNIPFVKVRPDWLKNPKTNQNLEIDGYNEELKLGFEHHGKQHYTEVSYFHNNQIWENDSLKREILKKNGIRLIEIPQLVKYTKLKDLKNLIYSELKKLKIKPPVSSDSFEISDYDLYTYTRKKEKIHLEESVKKILNQTSFQFIQFKYDGGNYVKVKCSYNHKLTFPFQTILSNTHKCMECEFVFNSEKYEKPRQYKFGVVFRQKTQKTKKLIEQFNFKINYGSLKLLDGIIVNGNSLVEVECVNSHHYKSTVSNILRRGCRECNRMKKIKIETLIKSIIQKNGTVLNHFYDNGEFHFKIQCQRNHIFYTTNVSIRNNKWCPECKNLNRK
jgi:hypothetical protein